MTINEYLNYPMGKGASVFAVGSAKEKMIEKFTPIEQDMLIGFYDTGNTVVFHCEIPSESARGVFYDVIVEFPYDSKELDASNNIFDRPFQVYSNCPSFIYTYAYVFYKRGMLCRWLTDRYEKKTLTTAPTSRNEFGIIFYERSIFFALYYLKKNVNQSVAAILGKAKRASRTQIKSFISSQTDIKNNRQMVKLAESEAKTKTKKVLMGDKRNQVITTSSTTKPIKANKASGTRRTKTAIKTRGILKDKY